MKKSQILQMCVFQFLVSGSNSFWMTCCNKPKRIEAFDISPDGTRFATGFLDGSVLIYPTSSVSPPPTYAPRRIYATANSTKVYSRPHLSGITTVRFFPSSRVLLTSGLDFSLSILPADLPEKNSITNKPSSITVEPARTLRGHKRSVTATAIVGVGRNIISASMDSTIKLWDVPSGSTISTITSSSAILSMSMGQRFDNAPGQTAADEREVPEVQSSILFAGLRDGSFEAFDLASKKPFFHSKAPAQSQQLTSIAYSHQATLLATGSNTGLITIYDVRSSLDTPLASFVRQEGGEVLDLSPFTRTAGGDSTSLELAVATSDGLPYVAKIGPDGSIEADELAGVDCDPVRQVRVRPLNGGVGAGREIWTASDDGVVRQYLC